MEEVSAELLEKGPGSGGVQVDTYEKRVNFNGELDGGGRGYAWQLANGAETAGGTRAVREISFLRRNSR